MPTVPIMVRPIFLATARACCSSSSVRSAFSSSVSMIASLSPQSVDFQKGDKGCGVRNDNHTGTAAGFSVLARVS